MSYIGNSPGVASQRVLSSFTATSGQTVFTPSAGYTLGYLDVYQNGVKLIVGDDYTSSDGVTFTLTTGAANGDAVECVAYFPRGLSDGYLKSEADAKYVDLTSAQTVAGVKTFSSNPILSAGTINGIVYLNSSKVETSGSSLTFDGSTFAVTGATTISTTLGVTGLITSTGGITGGASSHTTGTFSSTLGVTGASTLGVVNASGAVGIATGLTFSQGGVLATTYGDGNSLHAVVKNTSNAGSMNLRYGTASVKSILYANDSSGDGYSAGIGTTSNHTFSLLANGVIGLTLTPSGNAVTIPGTLGVTGALTASNTTASFGTAGSGSQIININLEGGSGAGGGAVLNFKENGVLKQYVGTDKAITGSSSDFLIWNAIGVGFKVYTNAALAMTVASGGAVAINTTTTQYGKFIVASTAGTGKVLLDNYSAVPTAENVMSIYATATQGYIQSYNNGYKNIIICGDGGNVGIGTTSPGVNKLLVKASTGGTDPNESIGAFVLGDSGTYAALLRVKNAGNRGNIGNAIGSPLFLAEFNDATAMIIDKSGNVGIGTTSPTHLLHIVKDQAATTSLVIQNTSDANSSGNELRLFGNVNAANATSGGNQISFVRGSGYADWAIGQIGGTSNDLIFSGGTNQGDGKPDLATSERMRITPTHVVVVQPRQGNDPATGAQTLMTTATSTNDRLNLNFSMTGTQLRPRAGIGAIALDGTGGYNCGLAFYTRSAADGSTLATTDERMRIDSAGAVTMSGTLEVTGRLKRGGTYAGVPNGGNFNIPINSTTSAPSAIGFSKVYIWTSPWAGGANGDLIEITVGADHDGSQRVIYSKINGAVAGSAASFTIPNAGYTTTITLTLTESNLNAAFSGTGMNQYARYFVDIFQ